MSLSKINTDFVDGYRFANNYIFHLVSSLSVSNGPTLNSTRH